MIDTSISGDITIQDDQLQILPQFTFEEKTRFYITFEREVVVSYEGELKVHFFNMQTFIYYSCPLQVCQGFYRFENF